MNDIKKNHIEHILEKGAWALISALASIAFALALAWARHVDNALSQQVELNREREKRMATLEAIVPDIRSALLRIEQNQAELSKDLRQHMIENR